MRRRRRPKQSKRLAFDWGDHEVGLTLKHLFSFVLAKRLLALLPKVVPAVRIDSVLVLAPLLDFVALLVAADVAAAAA